MTTDEALGHALEGDALLFTGAGFSSGAQNKRGHNLRLVPELTQYLAALAGAPPNAALQDAAEAYQTKFGAFALVEELRKEFTVSKIAEHHLNLAKVPWMRIFTTNYDNTLEFAARQAGRAIQAITTTSDPFALHPHQTACIHLNGYVLDLTPEALDNTFKLTDTSYVTASIADSSWATRFREDIRLARSVFFIGYSLYDLDIRRILAEHPNLREKSFFAVGKTPDQLLLHRLSRYGSCLNMTVSDIASYILDFQSSYTPRRADNLELQSVVELRRNTPATIPNDQAVFDLFELGVVSASGVLASLTQSILYYLERREVTKTMELIGNGRKVVALSSALGNGKTLLLKAIAIRAQEAGYRVFDAQMQRELGATEFERIARLPGKILLLVDNYQSWLKEIRSFRQVQNDHTRLVVTARDSLHDVLYEQLEEICGVSSVPEVQCDKLADDEITWFVNTLDRYGLWKSLAGKSSQEKTKLIKDRHGSEIHSVLLGLLESHDIGGRVHKLFSDVKDNHEYLEVVATVFILTTLGQFTTIETLTDLWGIDLLSSSQFKNHPTIRALFDFNSWDVKVKSSVVAEFILKTVLGLDLIPIMVKLTERMSIAARGVHRYMTQFTELTRYANLQRLLPEQGRLEGCVRYFEAIKGLPQAKQYPLFWLQYAIACFVEGELKRARIYFETAYSLADKRDFDSYQIDNHFARFLLVEAVELNLPIARALENFRQARAIINRQLQRNRLYYPYKTATVYQDFLDRFGKQFNDATCKEFMIAAEYVLEMWEKLPDEMKAQTNVKRCRESIGYVLRRCDELIIKP